MRAITLSLVLFCTWPAAARTVNVDCDAGKTIARALETSAGDVEIAVTGNCTENVVIDRDHVTVSGAGATLTAADDTLPAILVEGAQNVVISGLSISGGRQGIQVHRGSAATISAVTSSNNVRHGIIVIDHASAKLESPTLTGNGGDGLGVWNGSAVMMTGTIVSSQNGRAGIIISGSSLTALGPGSVALHDNPYGVFLQLSADAQFTIPVDQSGGDEGIGVYDGSSIGMAGFEARGNSWAGVSVWNNGTFESWTGPTGAAATLEDNQHGFWVEDDSSLVRIGPTTFTDNIDAAVYAEGSNVVLRFATGSNNGAGFVSRNSSVDFRRGTLAGAFDLSFGTRIEGGLNSGITAVNCDGTVISQFDHPCGYSAAAVPSLRRLSRRTPARREEERKALEP